MVSAQLVPEAASPERLQPAADDEPVLLRIYVDPKDPRSRRLREAADGLVRGLRGQVDVRVEVLDVTSPATDIEAAGVLAVPTIVRLGSRPPVRVIGWFDTPDDLADALQLPLPRSVARCLPPPDSPCPGSTWGYPAST